jgi:DNA primase
LYELYYAKRTKKKAQSYNINSWSEPAANVPWAQEYLHKRGFDDSLIQRYNLRAASLPIIGIVIPDVVYPDGTTNFFQYRFVGENKFKYTNPTEADKPVFGQHTLTGNTRAFVCEGCFSSMSMGKVPGWGALATYGKAIAPEQMKVLTKLKVDHYCLVYDGGEVDAILNTAAMLLETGKTVSALLLPFKEDPNSMSAEQLQASLENYELPINSLYLSIIRNYCKQSKIRNMQAQPWAQLRSYVVRLLDRSSAENNRSSEVQLR